MAYPLAQGLIEELAQFAGRDAALRKVMRYSMYDVMFYRSSVYAHEKRVAWLAESVGDHAKKHLPGFDVKRAVALALVHDDPEMETGDIQAGYKKQMTAQELQALEDDERGAIERMAKRFPTELGGYSYKDLMLEVLDLTTPEARVAKYLDRFDAFGEALHDLSAGNSVLTVSVVTEKGPIPIPPHFYREALPVMQQKYAELRTLKDTHLFFEEPIQHEWAEYVKQGRPHTLESFARPNGHAQYDAWKAVMLAAGDEEELRNLTTQAEFLR